MPRDRLAYPFLGPAAEPSPWLQSWQTTEYDAQPVYYLPQSHDQQHHLMINTDSAYNQASAPGYSKDWSKYF